MADLHHLLYNYEQPTHDETTLLIHFLHITEKTCLLCAEMVKQNGANLATPRDKAIIHPTRISHFFSYQKKLRVQQEIEGNRRSQEYINTICC